MFKQYLHLRKRIKSERMIIVVRQPKTVQFLLWITFHKVSSYKVDDKQYSLIYR